MPGLISSLNLLNKTYLAKEAVMPKSFKSFFNSLLFMLLSSSTQLGWAFELSPQSTNGIYQLAQPERSAAGQTQKLQIEYSDTNGQTVLVAASCPRCPPAGYKLLATESKELGRPVFYNSSGIYIIAYDDTTLVSVMADAQLGKKIWTKLAYANVYNKQGSPGITLEAGKQFVIAESKRLMTGEGIAASKFMGGNGTYFAAARQTIGSEKYDQIDVTIYPKQKIVLTGMNCNSCGNDFYNYESELSQATGKNVYEMGNMGRFLIEQKTGELWWTNAKLGKTQWGKNDYFNVITQDKVFSRKVMIDKTLQAKIDSTFESYASQSKAAVDARYEQQDLQRTANNKLPKRGMTDSALDKAALTAAQDWAGSYSWKETLMYTYMTSRDWSILRHPLTGIQTGRRISGMITMKRPDGLCSYQGAIFEQAYNGSTYQKTKMVGVVPGQNKLDCGKI